MLRARLAVIFGLVVGLVTVAAAQDKQKFETKFEKDKPFYQKLSTKVEQTLKVTNGSDVPLKHELTFFFKWTPVTVEKDKVVAKQMVEGVKFRLSVADQTIEYDSTDTNPTGAASNPGVAEFFKNLIGSEFTVTFGKGMVVEKVDGRDDILKKLASVNPQMETVLRQTLSDEALKEMTDPSAGLTAPVEKGPNETWEKKGKLSLGPVGAYERTFTYTYKGKDPEKKDLDRIEVKPSLTYQPAAATAETLPFKIKAGKIETKEVKQGIILYNPKSGRVESVRINIIIQGELDVTIQSTDTKVAIFQDQKTELDSGDVSFLPKKP